jgi:hypothetical protein
MGTRGTLGSWGWDVEDGPFAGTVSEVLDRQREVMRLTADTPLIDGWVTLVGHDLMSDELVTAASQLLDHLIDDQRELLTIITGDDATVAQTDQIVAWVSQNRPDVAVEIHGGGQPLYPYLFGVE